MKYLKLLALMLLLPNSASAKEWVFNAYLDGQNIGQHSFVQNDANEFRELTSQAKFNVKVLFINAYQYQHSATEKWQGDCLVSLDARTQENKEISVVKGRLDGKVFLLDGPRGRQILPACPMTFAYWNPRILNQNKLLNPQTGEWLDVKISSLGSETIQVRGKSTEAERFRLEATKMKIDLWYSPDKEWLALQSTTPEGYVISYKLR